MQARKGQVCFLVSHRVFLDFLVDLLGFQVVLVDQGEYLAEIELHQLDPVRVLGGADAEVSHPLWGSVSARRICQWSLPLSAGNLSWSFAAAPQRWKWLKCRFTKKARRRIKRTPGRKLQFVIGIAGRNESNGCAVPRPFYFVISNTAPSASQ